MTERREADPPQVSDRRDLAPTNQADRGLARTDPAWPELSQPALPTPQPPTGPATSSVPLQGPVNAVGQATNVNVTTNVGGPTIVFAHQKTGPNFAIRALWYLFIGWWASAFAIVAAYVALFAFIGIPLAFFIFNRLPTILTLRPRTQRYSARSEDGITYIELGNERQRPWWQRAGYFLVIGWWVGAVWLVLAWVIGLLVVTLPLSFWMYNRVSGAMTLHRH